MPAAASASTVSVRTPRSAKAGLSGRTGARVMVSSVSLMEFWGCPLVVRPVASEGANSVWRGPHAIAVVDAIAGHTRAAGWGNY
ncbi:hypothetical protein Pa4123_30970 [Phytohabitans aurantiacus]|uniref:Uncharacterized protein n=1 Tax=Phytohabitans aurantiacus TaxID=3016789 RepID=A0ABQ5QUZ7_9ACTN|nr:hypothetical protein Pa4123_30970 [Phytohabitans aurantiacus]